MALPDLSMKYMVRSGTPWPTRDYSYANRRQARYYTTKPPHLLSADGRNKVVAKDAMFIDLGCSSKKEAEALGVRIGDPVVPSSAFSTFEKTTFSEKSPSEADDDAAGEESGIMQLAMGKAFDEIVGAFVVAEVVRRLAEEETRHPNSAVGAGTVQEEVGVRGANTAG